MHNNVVNDNDLIISVINEISLRVLSGAFYFSAWIPAQ